MNIFVFIRDIYFGKKNVFTHLSLFSVFGIMAICLNNAVSNFIGYPIFLPKLVSDIAESNFNSILAILLFFYSLGYIFYYTNRMLNDENYELPPLALKVFDVFIRMLPLFVVWVVYYLLLIAFGLMFFRVNSLLFRIYILLLFFSMPFVGFIYTAYSKDFELKLKFFKFISLIRVIPVTFAKMVLLFIQILLLGLFFTIIVWVLFKFSTILNVEIYKIMCRLFCLCLGVYFLNILNLFMARGFVQIIKDCKLI